MGNGMGQRTFTGEKGSMNNEKTQMINKLVKFIILAALVGFIILLAMATYGDQVSLYLENDVIFSTDHYYTHGTRIEYWPSAGDWNASIGQNMYTPDDKLVAALQPYDRPYAGYLYGAVGYVTNDALLYVETELQVGMTGPDAYGKQTQDCIHKLVGSGLWPGWNNQIHNSFIVQNWTKVSCPSDISSWFDIVPNATFDVGLLEDYASAGVTSYLGYNLPAFAPVTDIPLKLSLHQPATFRAYLDAGAEARYVAYNRLLEDPRYAISVSPVVCRGYAGVNLEYDGHALVVGFEMTSVEFREQPAAERFGTVELKFNF